MNLPQLRIARITSLEKYNTTGSAANVIWDWKKVTKDQLQYLNEKNEWVPVEIVEIFDDSEKRKEEQAVRDKIKAQQTKDLETYTFLKSLEKPQEHWHKTDMNNQLCFLLDVENAQFCYTPDKDGFTYYHSKNGAVARVKNNEHFIRADILLKFLNPERFMHLFKNF